MQPLQYVCKPHQVSGVSLQGVANRDIKLENTLLDGSPRPLLKICDFGYSKVPNAALISCSASHYCALYSVHITSKCLDIQLKTCS